MPIPGNLLTTAMAVMPHTDPNKALETALSLDVPFWPQLPNYSYYEDMYVQASEHFPGILLDMENRTLRFSMEKFTEELEETLSNFNDPSYFDISKTYSSVYHQFLEWTWPTDLPFGASLKVRSALVLISRIRTNGQSFLMIPYVRSCSNLWQKGSIYSLTD